MREGWEIKRLGDIIQLEYGKPLPDSKRKADGKYPVYGANGEKDRTDEYYYNKKSIIVGRKGSAGEVNLTESKFWPLDVTYFVTFEEKDHDLKFLYHLLTSLELPKLAKGVKPGINRNEVYDISLLIPSLSEQKRIVEILDEAFAAIDKAKANVEKNLQNAKELFESYLQSVFSNHDWEESTLGEVCEFQNGQAHEKQIDENGKYILVNSRFVSSNGEDFKRTSSALSPLHKGDIVLVMSDVPNGKTLAKCFLIDKDDTYSLNQRICVIRSKTFNKRFLYYQLNRHRYLLAFNNGENQTNLRKNDILNCPLYVPPMDVQKRIVERLDNMVEESTKLDLLYQQKFNDLEELKKSILQKAFTGDLIAATKTLIA